MLNFWPLSVKPPPHSVVSYFELPKWVLVNLESGLFFGPSGWGDRSNQRCNFLRSGAATKQAIEWSIKSPAAAMLYPERRYRLCLAAPGRGERNFDGEKLEVSNGQLYVVRVTVEPQQHDATPIWHVVSSNQFSRL